MFTTQAASHNLLCHMTPSKQRVTASPCCTSHTKGQRGRNLPAARLLSPSPFPTRKGIQTFAGETSVSRTPETKVPILANNTHPQKKTIFFAAKPFLCLLRGGFLPAWNFHQPQGWHQIQGCGRILSISLNSQELPINEDRKVCTYILYPTGQKTHTCS